MTKYKIDIFCYILASNHVYRQRHNRPTNVRYCRTDGSEERPTGSKEHQTGDGEQGISGEMSADGIPNSTVG